MIIIPPYIPKIAIPQSQRNQILEKSMIQAYAEVIFLDNITCDLCDLRDCECLWSTRDMIQKFLPRVLERVDEDEVMITFQKIAQSSGIPLNELDGLKYECRDARHEILGRRSFDFESILLQGPKSYIH